MAFNLGTATGRILIDGSGAQKGFGVATAAANVFYNAVSAKLDSVERLGDNLIKVGTAGTAGLGLAVRSAANFEAGLSAVKAVSGATTAEMELLRKKALAIGKDTSFSASEAVDAISELSKAGVSTTDILSGAADATVALAAAGEIDLPRAAEIASSAINNFALSGKELPHVADLIAGAANASAIDVGDFGFSLSQAGAVANLTGLSFDDLAVAIAEMGQAGIKGSDAGTSIKTFLTNLIPTTTKQLGLFRELGLVTVRAGGDMGKLAKLGIKPVDNSYKGLTDAMGKYIEKQGGADVGTAKNAKAVQELGAKLGITGNAFFDAHGKMKPFVEIQGILAKATKNLSKEQKLEALNTLFGSDAIRASAVFANEGAAGFDKMAGAIGKVKAADVAKTRLDNLNGSIEQLKGSFETMQIIIGSVFLPVVRRFVDALNSLIGIFLGLPEPVQKAIAIFIGIGSAMSLLTGIAIKLAFALGPVLLRMLGFAALRQVFSIFTVGFGALRAGTGVFASLAAMGGRAGVVFTRFARIGRFLFSVLVKFPRLLAVIRGAAALAFGPWGIALALLVGAVILAYNKFKPFHDLVNKIAEIFKGVFLQALTGITNAWHQFTAAFSSGQTEDEGTRLEALALILRNVWQLVQDLGRAFMEHVVPALKAAGGQILQSLISAWHDLQETFRVQVLPALHELSAAFQTLLPSLQALWVQIQPVVKILGIVLLGVLAAIVIALYALVKVILVFVLPALIFLITKGIQNIINVLQFFIEMLIVVISAVLTFAKSFVAAIKGAVEGVSQMIRGIVSVFKGVFNVIAGLISGDWARAWQGAKTIVEGFKNIILGLLRTMVSLAFNIIKGFVTGIINFFKGLFNTLVGHSIVPDMVNAIIRLLATLPGRAAGALASLGSQVLGRIRSAMTSMLNGVRAGINNVVAAIRGLPSRMRGALGNLGGILVSAGRQIIQGLLNGINSMIGSVKSKLNSLTGMIPDWKGPLATDKKLLTANGTAIIQSLLSAFQAQLPKIEDFLAGLTKLIASGVTVPETWTVDNGVSKAISAGAGSSKKKSAADIARELASRKLTALPTKIGKPTVRDSAVTVINNNHIYNPVAEKSSVTLANDATRRANLGVLA